MSFSRPALWEREQQEYQLRKEDSMQAIEFLFWLILGATLVAVVKALVEWI